MALLERSASLPARLNYFYVFAAARSCGWRHGIYGNILKCIMALGAARRARTAAALPMLRAVAAAPALMAALLLMMNNMSAAQLGKNIAREPARRHHAAVIEAAKLKACFSQM